MGVPASHRPNRGRQTEILTVWSRAIVVDANGGKPHGGTKIAYDFFCGAGGLARGLLDAGIEVVAGFDRDPQRQATYKRNNPPAKFVLSDIRDLRPRP